MLTIHEPTSASDFLQLAGPLLYQNEGANGLMIGLAESLSRSTPETAPLLVAINNNGVITTGALQTPPHNLLLTFATTSELEVLAKYLHQKNLTFPGVVGPTREAHEFAQIWSQLKGLTFKLGMDQKIYQLDHVKFPSSIPGQMHVVNPEEIDFLVKWLMEFAAESLPEENHPTEYWKKYATRIIGNQGAHFWELNGTPVSMAIATRPTKHTITLNCIYTPKEARRKGFASILTATLSQKQLDSGRQYCLLYTDTSNPTSNKIYQQIGYQEVCGSRHYLFAAL